MYERRTQEIQQRLPLVAVAMFVRILLAIHSLCTRCRERPPPRFLHPGCQPTGRNAVQTCLRNGMCTPGHHASFPLTGRNLGEDLLPEPLRDHPRPTETDALTCTNLDVGR